MLDKGQCQLFILYIQRDIACLLMALALLCFRCAQMLNIDTADAGVETMLDELKY